MFQVPSIETRAGSTVTVHFTVQVLNFVWVINILVFIIQHTLIQTNEYSTLVPVNVRVAFNENIKNIFTTLLKYEMGNLC